MYYMIDHMKNEIDEMKSELDEKDAQIEFFMKEKELVKRLLKYGKLKTLSE